MGIGYGATIVHGLTIIEVGMGVDVSLGVGVTVGVLVMVGVKVGSGGHWFSSTDTLPPVPLAVTMSGLPLPSKSPTPTERWNPPTVMTLAGAKLPIPSPVSTDTSSPPTTARSRALSPLKSPTATESGLACTGKLVCVPKPPKPLFVTTETLLELELAVTASR